MVEVTITHSYCQSVWVFQHPHAGFDWQIGWR